ncbi:MAG: glycosyltransferase, partial [Oligoflexales bacterium]|nr:glycosyltransferase [Oligoflexales bacterium]
MTKINSDKKPKIAVIANDLSEGGFLHNFGQWLDAFDTTLFMFERRVHYTNLNLSCEMRLFTEAPETPGYMRGLEDQLQNFDLVVANNAGHFSSFQAMRAAKKWNLPFILINHDTQPFFYKPYKNIWAIRHDNFLQADKIWVSSQLAKSVALSEGADKEKLSVLKFDASPVDFKKFTIARKRFRKYLKINDEETILLFKSPLESAFQPEVVLKALLLASEQSLIDLSRFKVIFCGSGSLSDQLKYDSFKYKVGSSSLFLHQDVTPFISDLYSASDAVIYIPDEAQQTLLHFPNDLLEATNYGLTSITGKGSLYEELANDLALTLAKISVEHLALTFSQLQSERETIFAAREFFIKHQRAAVNQFKNQTINDLVSLVYRDGGRSKFPSLQEAFSDMLSLVNSNQDPNALVAIENLLLMDDFKGRPRSEALRIKGDILFREGDFDQASQSYVDSLRFFNSNHNSLRGLGSLSW